MTFYLKYRPQTIDQLDLENVRNALTALTKSKNLPHALLFSGPRGSGKTSAARILAKVINCENQPKAPCNKCNQCTQITNGANIDVIEMDAASNRGIDDIRALREQVSLSPSAATKKIYIIDEAHMLTTEAANALLKTLEEPPSHVMFILATTDPDKLPDTVRSRLTNIKFTKANQDEIKRQLTRVIRGEKIKIKKEAITLIAQNSDGSFREAVKLIELATTKGTKAKTITSQTIENIIHGGTTFDIQNLFGLINQKDSTKAILVIEDYVNSGGSVKLLNQQIQTQLHLQLLAHEGIAAKADNTFSKPELISFTQLFSKTINELKSNIIPQLPIEIAISKWCEPYSNGKQTQTKNVQPQSTSTPLTNLKTAPPSNGNSTPIAIATPAKPITQADLNDELWSKVISAARNKNTTVEALLRATKPLGFDGSNLNLGVFYKFHKERLEATLNMQTLEEVLSLVFGKPVKVNCTLTEPEQKQTIQEEVIIAEGPGADLTSKVDKDIIQAAKEIFDL